MVLRMRTYRYDAQDIKILAQQELRRLLRGTPAE
jgi:hypothetical protein